MKSAEEFRVWRGESKPGYFFDVESFYQGRFVGISICNYSVDKGDYGGIVYGYTPHEVFKVHSVMMGKASFFHSVTTHEVILEAYNHQLFSLYCNVKTGTDTLRINGSTRYIDYEWVLDEKLVAWIEREYSTERKGPRIDIKFYGSALEVKKQIQENAKAKEEARQKAREVAQARAVQNAAEAQAQAARAAVEKQAAAEIDDIFYGM